MSRTYEGDMIVNLTQLPKAPDIDGIRINRVFPADRTEVLRFIAEHFGSNWACEAEYAMQQCPPKCFIAVKANRVVGFCCYDASAPDFFGPIGVSADCRGRGIGAALLLRALNAMREEGYIYAVIGWVSDAARFYEKLAGAAFIPGGTPQNSVYANMIASD